jgi:aryl-alcohol dehydrogenase-like predicted oxidoreductase
MTGRGATRREFLGLLGAAGAGAALPGLLRGAAGETLITRPIPGTGERLPAVGLGTWQSLTLANRDNARAIIQRFIELGGSVIDTSPMYGDAEQAIGTVASNLGVLDELFLATKVWTDGREAGRQQIERSFDYLEDDVLDLVQVHNLRDWRAHLDTLRGLKSEGRIRYLGITHYVTDAHDDLERIVRETDVDFIQVNYNLAVRDAANSLLPAAMDRGVAVLVNRPFEGGSLFARVKDRELPGWAAEIGCSSFAQVFLKYLLGHPAVTCPIPGTDDPAHLEDNMGAMRGSVPDARLRRRIESWFDTL